MATYAIGDVQGCYEAFMRLLDQIRFDEAQDRLWFVGDLVNRGPESLKTLRCIKQLGKKHIVVLGNHDLHLLAVAYGYQSMRSLDTFHEILLAPDQEELMTWLRQRPLFHYDPNLDFAMVHAGIYPQWSLEETQAFAQEAETVLRGKEFKDFLKVMYGNEPDYWNADLAGFDRIRFIINVMTRMRYCNLNHHLELNEKGELGKQPTHLKAWFQAKRDKPLKTNVVFGHWATLNGVTNTPHVFATDTGCAWGYALTALRLEDQVSFCVPCEKPNST